MQIKLLTLLFAIFISSNVFPQSGWIVETINPAYNLEIVSYKDTNVCQLIQKFNISGTPLVVVSTNGTSSWSINQVFGVGIKDAQFLNPSNGILINWSHNNISLYKTNNYGINWSSAGMITVAVSYFDRIYFSSQDYGFIWGEAGIIRTTNGGTNWNQVFFAPVSNFTNMYFVSQETGFINGTNSGTSFNCIAKTTNAGANWTLYDLNTTVLKIDFGDVNTGYAVCSGSQYIKTTNQGLNWQVNTVTPSENLISLSFVNANTGYLLSQSLKILKTTNGGLNWSIQNLPQAGVTVRDVEFASGNRGVIICTGGKIMKTSTGGEILGIQTVSNIIPDKYRVSQNYPNPFNPFTHIIFDLPVRSETSLIVYDQLGREVEILVNEELAPGSYKFDWDASNYPSGIYFYRLQAGEYTETKKLVLIK